MFPIFPNPDGIINRLIEEDNLDEARAVDDRTVDENRVDDDRSVDEEVSAHGDYTSRQLKEITMAIIQSKSKSKIRKEVKFYKKDGSYWFRVETLVSNKNNSRDMSTTPIVPAIVADLGIVANRSVKKTITSLTEAWVAKGPPHGLPGSVRSPIGASRTFDTSPQIGSRLPDPYHTTSPILQ